MTETLDRFKGGLGISMRRMKMLELNKDGKTAQMGAGLISGEVIRKLEKLNKRTGMKVCRVTSYEILISISLWFMYVHRNHWSNAWWWPWCVARPLRYAIR
jgi:hypothetical protein